MKILKVELKNINSVKGEWVVDFTNEKYRENHNQFVICGETGSGKTTILDAITLALYGKTPREKVSKVNNENMCKGTGEMSAAVTYECDKGIFRSVFSQRRARMRAEGTLQEPECSIENLTTSERYDVKSISSLSDTTTKIVGLDYDQFCKSILLAQGSFDLFLKSDEGKKAEILAKLSGTEHYKAIGKKLIEKSKEVLKECEDKKKEYDNCIVFSDEELSAKEKELGDLESASNSFSLEKKEIEAKITWREKFDEINSDLNKNKEAYEELKIAEQEFAENGVNLELANNAAKCEVAYSAFSGLEDECTKLNKNITKTEKEVNEAKRKVSEAETYKNECETSYNELNDKTESNRKLWKEVRELDNDISGKTDAYKAQISRKNKAEEAYNAAKKTKQELTEDNEAINRKVKELESELEQRKDDEEIATIIPTLEEKKKSVKKQVKDIKDQAEKEEKTKKELSSNRYELERLDGIISKLDDQLKQFVSTNYKSVSKVLRGVSIKKGMPCPVCGSISHPYCEENSKDETNTSEIENDNSIIGEVLELSSSLEENNNAKIACKNEIDNLLKSLAEINKSIESQKNELSQSIEEINQQVSKWNLSIDLENIENSLDDIIFNLRKVSKEYDGKKSDLENNKKILSENTIKIKAINTEELHDKSEEEKNMLVGLASKLEEKKNERFNKFKDKSVDDEESSFEGELKRKKETFDKAKEAVSEAKETLTSKEGSLDTYKQNLRENNEKLDKSKKSLEEMVVKNGFATIDDFINSRIEQEKLEVLNKENDELKQKKSKLNSLREKLEGDLDELRKKGLITETLEELKVALKDLDGRIKTNDQNYGALKEKLKVNRENVVKKSELKKNYDASVEKSEIYTQIKEMIGKADGRDFEIFVQKMTMGNLIDAANRYLHQIFPQYTLVQETNSLELLLQDQNYAYDNGIRHISNVSGGEGFALSLSLALGIAELSSKNVQVESLFLDEGFGTMSGEALNQSIDALRRLRSTGKMLGIITHVGPVIDAFDQKITARKVNGVSTLEGDGISRVTTVV